MADKYVNGRGFIPQSTLPTGKPVRGMRKIANKADYSEVHVGMNKPTKKAPAKKKPATRRKTTRARAATTRRATTKRQVKKLPGKKRGGLFGLFGW